MKIRDSSPGHFSNAPDACYVIVTSALHEAKATRTSSQLINIRACHYDSLCISWDSPEVCDHLAGELPDRVSTTASYNDTVAQSDAKSVERYFFKVSAGAGAEHQLLSVAEQAFLSPTLWRLRYTVEASKSTRWPMCLFTFHCITVISPRNPFVPDTTL